jgi:hypothetical protein
MRSPGCSRCPASAHRVVDPPCEGLGREVVDLVRLTLLQQRDQRELVEEVPFPQLDPVLQVGDPLEVIARRPADHAVDLVALFDQEIRR